MSNSVNLTRTKFIDLKSGEEHFGYRIFDDYSMGYSMFSSEKAEVDCSLNDDKQFLINAFTGAPSEIIELVLAARDEYGLNIDGIYYDTETISDWLEEIPEI